jgi:hypothetical protein
MKIFSYIASIFDESAPSSFSRWATAFTVLTGCWAVIYLVRTNHALPGPADLLALGVWMTSPYGINKIAAAWGAPRQGAPPTAPPDVPTPA